MILYPPPGDRILSMVRTVIAFFLTLLATLMPALTGFGFTLSQQTAAAADCCCCCQMEDGLAPDSVSSTKECADLSATSSAVRGSCCSMVPVAPVLPPPPVIRFETYFYPAAAPLSSCVLPEKLVSYRRENSLATAFHLASNKLYLQTRVLLI